MDAFAVCTLEAKAGALVILHGDALQPSGLGLLQTLHGGETDPASVLIQQRVAFMPP